jgi:hypothetical protein
LFVPPALLVQQFKVKLEKKASENQSHLCIGETGGEIFSSEGVLINRYDVSIPHAQAITRPCREWLEDERSIVVELAFFSR